MSFEAYESSVVSPPPGWARRLPRDERVFLVLVATVATAMSVFVLAWLFFGGQNVPAQSYRTTPEAFTAQVTKFVQTHTDAQGRIAVPPGDDAYMMAGRYTFYPEIVLKAGQEYTLWISSVDALHGFSLVGGGQNINLEIAPGHAYGATFTPEQPGTYLIVCNEYCGLGHHQMKGRIVVER